MRRRMLAVVGLAVMLGVGAGWRSAQAETTSTTVLVGQTTLDDIYKKLDEIVQQRRGGGGAKDIEGQLAQILKNQEAMMAELQVIKIRATRR